MIRNNVVLPEPDGPSNASNSPFPTFKSTSSSAANAPNVLMMLFTSMVIRNWSLVQAAFKNGLRDQRDQGQQRQQRRDRERRYELIFVVKNFDQQRHGIGLAANMARHHRHRAEFTHRARVAQQYTVQQAPFDVGQGDP